MLYVSYIKEDLITSGREGSVGSLLGQRGTRWPSSDPTLTSVLFWSRISPVNFKESVFRGIHGIYGRGFMIDYDTMRCP